MKDKNTLFLVPVGLSDTSIDWYLPHNVLETIHSITHFIVENAKTARHFLKFINHPTPLQSIEIYELDKHDLSAQISDLKTFLGGYSRIGLMSEAGLPCIADPGTHVVKLAHEMNMQVKPLTGPSSILLALIASGFNGQSFKFLGYIPTKGLDKKTVLQQLENESNLTTQLFIEAPYRNDQLLTDLCQILKPTTMLMLAIDLTGENENIISKPIGWWKQNKFVIGKVPCLFALGK